MTQKSPSSRESSRNFKDRLLWKKVTISRWKVQKQDFYWKDLRLENSWNEAQTHFITFLRGRRKKRLETFKRFRELCNQHFVSCSNIICVFLFVCKENCQNQKQQQQSCNFMNVNHARNSFEAFKIFNQRQNLTQSFSIFDLESDKSLLAALKTIIASKTTKDLNARWRV